MGLANGYVYQENNSMANIMLPNLAKGSPDVRSSYNKAPSFSNPHQKVCLKLLS